MKKARSGFSGTAVVSNLTMPRAAGWRPAPRGWALVTCLALLGNATAGAQEPPPTSADPDLTIARFADSGLINHPTGITFTADGKLLVIESHLRPGHSGGCWCLGNRVRLLM